MENFFEFYAVGQGLFYGGCIDFCGKPFRIVYDCGSSDGLNGLLPALNRYARYNGTEPIDLLVLSHFHFDHFCGIPALLKNRGAKLIVMPYCTPFDRLVLASEIENSRLSSDEKDLLRPWCSDPLSLLGEYAENIAVMMNPEDFDEEWEDRPRDGDFYQGNFINLESFNRQRKYVYLMQSSVRLSQPVWEFMVHRPKLDPKKKKLREAAVSAALQQKSPEEILGDKNELKKFSRLLKAACKQDENLDSVLLYHAPIKKGMRASEAECPCPPYCKTMRTGTLLTGDADLANEWAALSSGLRDDKDNIGIFQVPHHGAASGFTDYRFDVCAVSYGVKNHYGHPKPATLKEINAHGCELRFVNENNNYFYRIY